MASGLNFYLILAQSLISINAFVKNSSIGLRNIKANKP
jgi:hypothetical protein